jgi:hypothetical protein
VFYFYGNKNRMASSISDKLRIKPKFSLLTLNAPAEFKKGLQGLPAGVKITDSGKDPIAIGYQIRRNKQ